MKVNWTLGIAILFGLYGAELGAAPQFGQSRERNRNQDRVCIYPDIRFQGSEQCFSAGDQIPILGGRNSTISSIRIFGGARATVYEETNFRGRSAEIASDIPDLGSRNAGGLRSWSDHIQSLRVSDYSRQPDENRAPIYGRSPSSRFPQYPEQQERRQGRQVGGDGVCVYERPDFQGRSQCWNAGENLSDLGRAGNWSDKISSIRVFGRTVAVLYRDIGFYGQSITVDRDIADLGRGWNRQASSLQVGQEGRVVGRALGRRHR